jgi:hypothetical protein
MPISGRADHQEEFVAAANRPRPDPRDTRTAPDADGEFAFAEGAARVALRPIASPLTLGFLALAVGTFILAGLQLSWISPAQSPEIGLALMVFVFPLQAVSSVFGFLARDSIAGTGTGLLSGTWLSIGVITFTSPPGHTSGALGLLLLGAATALLVPAAVGVDTKPLASLVIAGVALRFFLTAAYELSSAAGWKYAAATEGLLLALLALYAGLAFELEDSRLHTVLPTFRRGTGRKAISGSPRDELASVYREAGVRKKL